MLDHLALRGHLLHRGKRACMEEASQRQIGGCFRGRLPRLPKSRTVVGWIGFPLTS
jgi:hypothetical protein